MYYRDRKEAGRALADALAQYKGKSVVVLALPRGGAVLGAEVAKSLQAPLGLILVRKIGHPAYPEYAIGAVAENESPLYDESETATVDTQWLKTAESAAHKLIQQRREQYYGDNFNAPSLRNRTAIIVDDGIATGLTMRAAVHAAKSQKPAKIIVAVPVASQESVTTLRHDVDQLIVLDSPSNFLGAVGAHYQEFAQVDDAQVASLLKEVAREVLQNQQA